MPVQYRFDSHIVIIEAIGEYSMADLRTTILNSLADSKCPANSVLLINLTESKSIYNRTTEDVSAMARFVATLGNRFHNRLALVASDNLPFGLMRMSSVGSEEQGITSRVFRTLPDARKWMLSGSGEPRNRLGKNLSNNNGSN